MAAQSAHIGSRTRVRISKSGQITLPAKIRQDLGVDTGDQVEIVRRKDGTYNAQAVHCATAAELAGLFGTQPDDQDVETHIWESVREGVERRMNRGNADSKSE